MSLLSKLKYLRLKSNKNSISEQLLQLNGDSPSINTALKITRLLNQLQKINLEIDLYENKINE